MTLVLRALYQLAKNWKAILALATLTAAVGFSGKIFTEQLGESVQKNSWIIIMICVVILVRECLKTYARIKAAEKGKDD